MDSVIRLLPDVGIAYLKAQIALLPLAIAYIVLARRGLNLPHRQFFHGALLVLSAGLPVVLLAPMTRIIAPAAMPPVVMPALNVSALVESSLRRPDITWVYLFAGLCGLAGIAWLCFHLVRQVLVERRISAFAKRHRRVGRVSVIVSPAVASSFTTGFSRPRIYLPTHLADDPRSRGMVLKHEFAHVRNGHLAWALIEQVYRRLFWFNPLAHFLFFDGRFVRELACDKAAVKQCTPVTYAQVLVHQAEWLLAYRGLVLVNPLHENGRSLARRVTFLMEEKMKKTTVLSVSVIAASTVFCAGLLIFAQGKTPTPVTAASPIPAATSSAAPESQVQPPFFSKGGEAQGARSRESIMKVVMNNLEAIRLLYNTRLKVKPGIQGTITVKFAINADGAMIFCEMLRSTLGDPTLENQVVAQIKGWKFEKIDKPGDVTEVVYPFTFSQ